MAPNDRWSLDFVSDQLKDGRRFRILTVVDDCTRESLALVADTSLSGTRGARELDRLPAHGVPASASGRAKQRTPDRLLNLIAYNLIRFPKLLAA